MRRGSGDHVDAATAKVEIHRGGFSVDKKRLFLLGGREAAIEGGNKWLNERVREGGILLLPLKLPGFVGELVPRSSNALTQAHASNRSSNNGGGGGNRSSSDNNNISSRSSGGGNGNV